MQTEQSATPEVPPEETDAVSHAQDIPRTRSHESLWGALLFAFMLLFVIVSIASIGWGTYSKWKTERAAKAEPSIAVLSEQANEQQNAAAADVTKTAESDQTKPSAGQADEDALVAVKKASVSVLNGGAAKGSAGLAVDFLKKEGYASVTPGNTLKDYAGTTLYYAVGLEKEAEIIKMTVIKKYPQVKTLPAEVKNKETSVAPVTLILGK